MMLLIKHLLASRYMINVNQKIFSLICIVYQNIGDYDVSTIYNIYKDGVIFFLKKKLRGINFTIGGQNYLTQQG